MNKELSCHELILKGFEIERQMEYLGKTRKEAERFYAENNIIWSNIPWSMNYIVDNI